MLKENQNRLKEKIIKIIKEIGHRQDIKSAIGKEFLNRNLQAHRPISIWMNPDILYTLTDSDEDIKFLFLFSVSLNKAMKDKVDIQLDVKEYFTPLEYQQWIGYKEENKEEDGYPIVFENAFKIGDRMWQTMMTSQRFAQFDNENKLIYNFKTQRNPKVTVSGITIDIDKSKPEKIKNRMSTGKQYPDRITFNVLRNFEEDIYHDEKNHRLIINKGFINLTDGQHRKIANTLAMEENPELEFIWPLLITNFTENEAADFITQINEQKPFKKEQIKEMNKEKLENLVVDVIADDRISKLNKIMGSQDAEVRIKRKLVTKNLIAEAISENFKLDETTDIRGLGKWIVEFTDYLFSLYQKEFITDPYSIQKHSVINNQNMFYGYISMAASYQEGNWKEKTKEKMQSIDFNINNPIWREIGILQHKPNKSTRNKIYKLFEEGVVS